MRSRSHRKKQSLSDYRALSANWPYSPVPSFQPYRLITVPTYLPRSVANQARREIYSYPGMQQRRLYKRALRVHLIAHGDTKRYLREPWHPVRVRIRVPLRLPLAAGSKVSLSRSRLTIHSVNSLRRSIERLEFNRRRYVEHKTNRRRARHGQLDSPGALSFGLVAHALGRGASIGRIADAALVARAIRRSM